MKVIEEGHIYELSNGEKITFIANLPDKKWPGVQNLEIFHVLLDRMIYLQGLCSCEENEEVLLGLTQCIIADIHRTGKRKKQKVEGTQLPHQS